MGANAAIKAMQRREKRKQKAQGPHRPPSPVKHLQPEKLGLNNPNQHIPVIRVDSIDAPNGQRLQTDVISDSISVVMDFTKMMEYINLPVFPGEREVTDSQVQYLFDCMEKGIYNWSNLQIAKILLNGVTYKGNGQHSAWAGTFMCEKHPGFASPPTVRETIYRVRNEEQMRALYATFDRNKVRSDGHINKVLLVNREVMKGVHNSSISKLVSGLKLWHWASYAERQRLLPDHIAAYIDGEIGPLFRTVAFFLQDTCKDCTMVWRQGVVAAMFATFEKAAMKATEFWSPVVTGLNLTKKTDPRWKLRDWLQRVSVGGGRSGATEVVSAEQMSWVCMSQWNRWRKGDDTSVIRPLEERPKVL